MRIRHKFDRLASELRRLILRKRRADPWPSDPDSPDDPYAYVGAPKKPRLPGLSASASAPLE